MKRGIVILVCALCLGTMGYAQDFQRDELASRDAQRHLAWEFRDSWLRMSYEQKKAFVFGFCFAIQTGAWMDMYMFLELELGQEVQEIIRAKTPRRWPTTEETIRWVDFYYRKERQEYADLGVVLWWFLHGNERPLGEEDEIREWESRIDERIYARGKERRK